MKTCLLSHEFVQLLRSAKKGLFQIPLQAEVWLAITKEKTFFVVALQPWNSLSREVYLTLALHAFWKHVQIGRFLIFFQTSFTCYLQLLLLSASFILCGTKAYVILNSHGQEEANHLLKYQGLNEPKK